MTARKRPKPEPGPRPKPKDTEKQSMGAEPRRAGQRSGSRPEATGPIRQTIPSAPTHYITLHQWRDGQFEALKDGQSAILRETHRAVRMVFETSERVARCESVLRQVDQRTANIAFHVLEAARESRPAAPRTAWRPMVFGSAIVAGAVILVLVVMRFLN